MNKFSLVVLACALCACEGMTEIEPAPVPEPQGSSVPGCTGDVDCSADEICLAEWCGGPAGCAPVNECVKRGALQFWCSQPECPRAGCSVQCADACDGMPGLVNAPKVGPRGQGACAPAKK